MIFAGSAAIWFLGWFIWDLADLWQYLQNHEYQHLLLLFISAWIIGALAKARPRGSPSENPAKSMVQEKQQQPENNPTPTPQSNPDLKALSAKVDEILEKKTDVRAIMRFFKT